MNKVIESIVINRPAPEVFEFAINPANTPRWVGGVVSEESNESPTRVGTIYRNQDTEGNWSEFEITDFETGTMFELKKRDDKHHVRYTFKPIETNTCELEYRVHADGDEVSARFSSQNIRRILEKLKEVVETY